MSMQSQHCDKQHWTQETEHAVFEGDHLSVRFAALQGVGMTAQGLEGAHC